MVTIVVINENWPSTISQKPGLSIFISISMPKVSSINNPTVVENSNIDMPRITPGITRGQSLGNIEHL